MHGLREIKQHNTDATNARIYRAALERLQQHLIEGTHESALLLIKETLKDD